MAKNGEYSKEFEAFNTKHFDEMSEEEIFQVPLFSIGASYEFVSDLLMPFGTNPYAHCYGNMNPSKIRVSFIKTDDDSCMEVATGTVFKKERDGLYSEETGLYFFNESQFTTISTKHMVDRMRQNGYIDNMKRFFGHFEKLQKRDSYLRGVMYKMALEEGKELDYETVEKEKTKDLKKIQII